MNTRESTTETTLLAAAHRKAILTPVSEIAKYLQDLLSRQLTAYMLGLKDGKTITRWANGETEGLRVDNERLLRAAYEIVQVLSEYESPSVARAWFIGMNPNLGDLSPAEALREGMLREVRSAARAFIGGSGIEETIGITSKVPAPTNAQELAVAAGKVHSSVSNSD